MNSIARLLVIGLLVHSTVGEVAWAQDKKIFTHMVDVRPGHDDALLDIFKPISEQFDSEARAIGTAYTAGEILYREKRYDDAARNFSTVITRGRKYAYMADTARIRLAQSYLLEGNFEEALRVAREVASSQNKFLAAEAWYAISRAYLANGKIDRAEDAYKNILTVNPIYANLLKVDLLAGLLAYEKGAYLDAATHFQRHSDSIPSLYYSIACFCQMKDIAKAVASYQSLLSKAKKGAWVDRARVLIGEAIYQTHDFDLSFTFFQPVSRKDAPPDLHTLALYRLACIDFQKKNYTRCELVLQNLLKEYPNHPLRTDWLYLVATIPVYERDWNRTIREADKYTSSSRGAAAPKSIPPEQLVPEAQFRVIWAYMALGNYRDVIKLTDKFFHKYEKNPLSGYALLLQGVAYDQIGNMDKAIDSYQTLVDLFPQSPAAGKGVYLMTLSLHKANESSRIVSALNHMYEGLQGHAEIKSDAWRKNTLFWIAEGYFSIQDYKHAEKTYSKFVEVAPDNPLIPYALQGLAASLAAQGPDKADQARIYEQQALERATEIGNTGVANDAKLQLGKIEFNNRNYADALNQFDTFIHSSTNTVRVAEALYDSGLTLYNQQYYSEALNRWKQVIDGYRFSPFRSQAYLQTGRTQFGLGHFDQAIAAYQSLAANYPNSPEAQEAQYQIIQCYYNKGDVRGAYQQFSAFRNTYPADERIKGTAEMLLAASQQGQKGGALHSSELGDLLRTVPGSDTASQILWERGAALFNKKDYAAAQKYFQRIMLSYPNGEYAPQAYFYNAECYFFLQNMDAAASAYKSFYINYPNDKMVPDAMFQVGVSMFNKKDFRKAAEGFDEFLKRFPNHAKSKDAALNVALCYKKAFRLDESIRAYQKYLLLFPNDDKSAFVRLQIGILHANKGDFSSAIKDFEQVPGGAERAEAQYRIGQAYANLHQDGKAKEAYQRLLSMGPRDSEYRVAGLMELAKMIEAANSTQGLSQVYSDIAQSSKNSEVRLMAEQKLKELKGGQ